MGTRDWVLHSTLNEESVTGKYQEKLVVLVKPDKEILFSYSMYIIKLLNHWAFR
jgi:hypothetical protein